MNDNASVGNDLKMSLSGRNKGLTVIVVDEFSKSSSYNDGEESEKQVEDHLVANKETIEISTE
jgi:hypothetical protein